MPVECLTPSALSWFKSSYSGGNTTECLEAAFLPRGVLIRDSKQADGPHLLVSSSAWARFVAVTVNRS
ncbi:DUF397 domain-containing protein [Streptomyces sp. 135]|uniref:DUF397 domain-containing protein n=1 Tax=Streptomyces sp. 135 TaxID=2838850 RepID=UPI001CBA9076|nr:DUF397 domain-containing protein [Streptomyces sp. 135]